MKIACFHTADSNVPLFDEAARDLDVTLSHVVRADLYQRALEQGHVDDALFAETASAVATLRADAVIVNCTTLGHAGAGIGAVRVDEALAEFATRQAQASDDPSIEVFVTTPTTIKSTSQLFQDRAAPLGIPVRITMVEGALPLFLANDLTGYAKAIAERANASEAEIVVLAQTSMAPAAGFMARPPLVAPVAALLKAVEKNEALGLS